MEEDEFITQMREWMKANPLTDEDLKDSLCSNDMRGELNPMYGLKHTEETKKLIREKAIGRKKPEGWGKRHAEKLRGKKHTLESRLKRIRRGKDNHMYGKTWNDEQKRQRRLKLGMKVTIDGVEYESKRQAAKLLGVSRPTIDNWLKNG